MAGRLGYMKPELAPTEEVTRDDIIWAAGIFEGEGHCRLNTNATGKHGQLCQVTQNDPWILHKLRNTFGGSVYWSPRNQPPKNGIWVWNLTGPRARGFLQTIYGLLSPSKQERARTTFDWLF